MSAKIPLNSQELLLRFAPALAAFEKGDVDYARRSLNASFRHHTKGDLTVTEEISLLWCLAWFDFYEGYASGAERLVKTIIALEERSVSPRQDKLAHAYFFIAMLCHSQGKEADTEINLGKSLSLIETRLGSRSGIYHAVAEIFSTKK